MIVPEKVQKILDKSKILEIVETQHDTVYWLKDPETYEEPKQINEIVPGWELHICSKGPHCIRMRK